jgi:hypothetical protein
MIGRITWGICKCHSTIRVRRAPKAQRIALKNHFPTLLAGKAVSGFSSSALEQQQSFGQPVLAQSISSEYVRTGNGKPNGHYSWHISAVFRTTQTTSSGFCSTPSPKRARRCVGPEARTVSFSLCLVSPGLPTHPEPHPILGPLVK